MLLSMFWKAVCGESRTHGLEGAEEGRPSSATLLSESVFTVFLNVFFDFFVTFAIEMIAYPCFLGIMNGSTDVRFTVDCVGDLVNATHNMSSSDRFGDLA